MSTLVAPPAVARPRRCDPACKAYRAGLRSALAEVVIMREEASDRGKATPKTVMQWKRKAAAYSVVATRLNALIYRSCRCGASRPARLPRVLSESQACDAGEDLDLELTALRILGAIDGVPEIEVAI